MAQQEQQASAVGDETHDALHHGNGAVNKGGRSV